MRAPRRNAWRAGFFGQSAYDQGRRRKLGAGQGVVLINHLHGQFASRDQDECCNAGLNRLLKETFDDWDQESQGFAGSGLEPWG